MTVSSTQSYIEYNGDGATTTFPIPFYFLLNSDISALVADASGGVSEPVNGISFTVTGAGTSGGGVLTANTTYPTGSTILIYRNPPVTQETKYYENGKFPAASHEAALDKLTMLIQEYGWRFDSLALKRPSFFSEYYDALNKHISNLRDPDKAQDAVNKRYVDNEIDSFKDYVDSEVATETAARMASDEAIQESVEQEVSARQEAIENIQEQLTGNIPLEASAFSVISWHKQTVDNSINIPDKVNAWSFGPTVEISEGQSVKVGEGSFWTIANGENQ
ncbi:phage tail fiber domain-containing protein [Atlantibacter hermannii]|uniref:phage tail fiber domain-containing protein n=1 Tax=Atlantibacter hermannii TaxID=565 RepID=UPI0028A03C35|nr:phage tail fiber protein [Atlantibacter hermannii]